MNRITWKMAETFLYVFFISESRNQTQTPKSLKNKTYLIYARHDCALTVKSLALREWWAVRLSRGLQLIQMNP